MNKSLSTLILSTLLTFLHKSSVTCEFYLIPFVTKHIHPSTHAHTNSDICAIVDKVWPDLSLTVLTIRCHKSFL